MLMPLQGDITLNVHIPRAMPWADNEKPLQGIKQHSLNNYVSIIPCILLFLSKIFLSRRSQTTDFCFCGTLLPQRREMGLKRMHFDNQQVTKRHFKTRSKQNTIEQHLLAKRRIVFRNFRRDSSVNLTCRKCTRDTLCLPTKHVAFGNDLCSSCQSDT